MPASRGRALSVGPGPSCSRRSARARKADAPSLPPTACGADPADGRVTDAVALIGERVVEELDGLAGPDERHAVLRQGQLRLERLALARQLRQEVALAHDRAGAANVQPEHGPGAGGRHGQARSRVRASSFSSIAVRMFAFASSSASPRSTSWNSEPSAGSRSKRSFSTARRVSSRSGLRLLGLDLEPVDLQPQARQVHPARDPLLEDLLLRARRARPRASSCSLVLGHRPIEALERAIFSCRSSSRVRAGARRRTSAGRWRGGPPRRRSGPPGLPTPPRGRRPAGEAIANIVSPAADRLRVEGPHLRHDPVREGADRVGAADRRRATNVRRSPSREPGARPPPGRPRRKARGESRRGPGGPGGRIRSRNGAAPSASVEPGAHPSDTASCWLER